MQTFLPYESFLESARCLDNKRLGKQRVECLQILNTLTGHSNGWRNHPAVRMWYGYTEALAMYGLMVCREWITRGFQDTCSDKISLMVEWPVDVQNLPLWLGSKEFHDSHKSNLLRKDLEYYGKFGWNVPNDLKYIWPT